VSRGRVVGLLRHRYDLILPTTAMVLHHFTAVTASDPRLVPPTLPWLAVFRSCFTAPVWDHILVLLAGAVLAPGITVTHALRVMGRLAEETDFCRYHELLSRARWDARAGALRVLLSAAQ
jgi:hypothetical protein